ncbi:hypothetical protein QUF72_13790 [Desulfobacterales bacterium HSG2]|nr:hypothetical protein [Desulfobacterales bacterium HSG2]
MDCRKNFRVTAGLYILAAIIFVFPFGPRADAEKKGIGSSQAGAWDGGESGIWGGEGKEAEQTSEPPEAFDSGPAFDQPVQEKKYFSYPSIHSVGFVRKRPAVFSGAIFKAKENKEMISKGDQVYVRERGEVSLIVGRHYTVYRLLKKIKDTRTNIDIGIQHFLTGVVEITEKHPRFAIGRVIRSFRDIALNDLLMPHIPRVEKIPLIESVKGFEGKVLAAENGAEIMGTHSILFIDKGKRDGIRSGQQYNVYYQEKALLDPKRSKEKISLPPVDFGRLIVLYAEHATSTALVIQSDKAIHIGTRIRSPVR